VPDAFIRDLRILNLSAVSAVFAGIVIITGIQSMLARQRQHVLLFLGIAASCGMAIEALTLKEFNYFDVRLFGYDCVIFFSFLAGLSWCRQTPLRAVLDFIRRMTILVASVLALTLIGLAAGLLTPVLSAGDRLATWSLYSCTYVLAITTPVLLSTDAHLTSSGRHRIVLLCNVNVALVLLAGLLAAARSTLVVGLVLATMVGIYTKKNWRAVLSMLAVVVVTAVLLPHLPQSIRHGDQFTVSERFSATSVPEETRTREANMLIDQLLDRGVLFTGLGFGSRFVSPVPVEVDGVAGVMLASAPHIGILTLLQKGGLLVFGTIVLCPLLSAIRRAVRHPRARNINAGACWGMVLYFTYSSLSGGWGAPELFLYGLLVALIRTDRA
jgi:hypothetical protein